MKCAWCTIETKDTYCSNSCRVKGEAKREHVQRQAGEREWRDVGGGQIRCDNTGKVARLSPEHTVDQGNQERTVTFTLEEWRSLMDLAQRRTIQSKTHYTPERCVREFAERAGEIMNDPRPWLHPLKTRVI